MFKISLVGIIFFALLATEGRNCGQNVQDKKSGKGKGMGLKLIEQYKKNKVKALSSDGKRVLFYQTSTPMRTFAFPLDGNPPQENKATVSDDMLRVIDLASKQESASIPTNFFPYNAEFIPGTNTVFYSERDNQAGVLQKIWNIDTNKVTPCLNTKDLSYKSDEGGLSDTFVVLDKTRAISTIWQRGSGHILVNLSLPDCTLTRIGPVNPDDLRVRISGFADYSSVSKEHVAFATREQKIIIRNLQTLAFIKEVLPPTGLRLGEQIKYTPDGKFLVVVASNTVVDNADTKRYLLFFDANNYAFVRQMDITSWSPPIIEKDVVHESNYVGTAMAISPDSNLIAIGFTRKQKTEEQAEVVLYDLKNGEELARASYPAIKINRDDPFAARIGKLIFTPDGKYLLSSTHDTLLWELKS